MDTIMAFPLFVLAMGIVAALGNTMANIIIATVIINLPFYCRFARAEVNVRRDAGYVEAARLGGNRLCATLARTSFPNVLPPMMVQVSLNMGWAILNAAGLSFIGLGVRPPTPEWGIMVSEGASYIISGEWWAFVFPGAALVLAVFCFNLLGDGLRDMLDPRKRVLTARCWTRVAVAGISHPARHRAGARGRVAIGLARRDRRRGRGERFRQVGHRTTPHGTARCARREISGGADRASADSTCSTPRRTALAGDARARDRDDLPEPAHRAQPDPQGRQADRGRAAQHGPSPRRDAGRRSRRWHACASPIPSAATTPIRSSCPGGMCQRVMIAMALACAPSLLIADEPTTGLDVTTQAVIMDLIRDLSRDTRMSTLLITHDLGLAGEYCDRIVVMHAGHVVEIAPTEELLGSPAHPYTRQLLASTPTPRFQYRRT